MASLGCYRLWTRKWSSWWFSGKYSMLLVPSCGRNWCWCLRLHDISITQPKRYQESGNNFAKTYCQVDERNVCLSFFSLVLSVIVIWRRYHDFEFSIQISQLLMSTSKVINQNFESFILPSDPRMDTRKISETGKPSSSYLFSDSYFPSSDNTFSTRVVT